ncbi:hypothetical protein AB0B21_08200 [Streptomyces rimosus]|nr:hypothetical protein [Streptomyces rimosus]
MGASAIATHRPTTSEYAARLRTDADQRPGRHVGSRQKEKITDSSVAPI